MEVNHEVREGKKKGDVMGRRRKGARDGRNGRQMK